MREEKKKSLRGGKVSGEERLGWGRRLAKGLPFRRVLGIQNLSNVNF